MNDQERQELRARLLEAIAVLEGHLEIYRQLLQQLDQAEAPAQTPEAPALPSST